MCRQLQWQARRGIFPPAARRCNNHRVCGGVGASWKKDDGKWLMGDAAEDAATASQEYHESDTNTAKHGAASQSVPEGSMTVWQGIRSCTICFWAKQTHRFWKGCARALVSTTAGYDARKREKCVGFVLLKMGLFWPYRTLMRAF